MNAFPWEFIYDAFAKPIAKQGLDKEDMTPKLFAVHVEDGAIVGLQPLPVAQFFSGPNGKDLLGGIIRSALDTVDDDAPFCLVMLSEAYMRHVDLPTDEEAEKIQNSSLKDDPKATECVYINIMRKHENRIGALPIMPDRSVKYAPLMHVGSSSGRFSSTGQDEGFRNFVKRHQGAK